MRRRRCRLAKAIDALENQPRSVEDQLRLVASRDVLSDVVIEFPPTHSCPLLIELAAAQHTLNYGTQRPILMLLAAHTFTQHLLKTHLTLVEGNRRYKCLLLTVTHFL